MQLTASTANTGQGIRKIGHPTSPAAVVLSKNFVKSFYKPAGCELATVFPS